MEPGGGRYPGGRAEPGEGDTLEVSFRAEPGEGDTLEVSFRRRIRDD